MSHSDHSMRQPVSAATALAVIGGALIVIAIIALVSANWSQFGSWSKILTVAAPMVALYLTVVGLWKKEEFHDFRTVALLTANLIFPFAVGVAYYELAGFPMLDANFYAVISGVTTIWYGFIEFGVGFRFNTILTLLAASFWLFSLQSSFAAEPWIAGLVVGAIGVLAILGSVLIWQPKVSKYQVLLYQIYGFILVLWSAFQLPSNFASKFAEVGWMDWATQLGYIVMSGVILGLAVYTAMQWKATKEEVFAQTSEAFERLFSFVFTFPVVFIALDSSDTESVITIVTALIVVVIGLLFSYRAAIRWLRILSNAALAILAFRLISMALVAVDLSWPLLVLGLGALLFIVAFAMHGKHSIHFTQWFSNRPTASWYGLGEERVSAGKTTGSITEVTRADGSVVRFVSEKDTSHTVFVVLASLLGIGILLSWMFTFFGSW
jgi:hypothetical protein